MTTLRNSFEGGSNGTGISVINSGGGSGDAFSYLSGTPTFSNAHAKSGSLSASLPGGSFSSLGYNLSATDIWLRYYLWISSNSDSVTVARIYTSAGGSGSLLGTLRMDPTRALYIDCGTGSDLIFGPVATSQWVRFEAKWSTTTGGEVRLYNSADSDTPTGSATVSSNMTGAAASIELIHVGSTLVSYFIDDYAVSTDGWIGPSLDAGPRSPLISRTAAQRASRW